MNTTITTKISEPDYEGIVFTEFFQQFGKLSTKKLNLNTIDMTEILGRKINNGEITIFSDEDVMKVLKSQKKSQQKYEARQKQQKEEAEAAYNHHRWGEESFD